MNNDTCIVDNDMHIDSCDMYIIKFSFYRSRGAARLELVTTCLRRKDTSHWTIGVPSTPTVPTTFASKRTDIPMTLQAIHVSLKAIHVSLNMIHVSLCRRYMYHFGMIHVSLSMIHVSSTMPHCITAISPTKLHASPQS